MAWMHTRQIRIIERLDQCRLVHVQKMMVGGDEDRNVVESGFGQNLPVIHLFFREESSVNQASRELGRDPVAHGDQVKGGDLPVPQRGQRGVCQPLLLTRLSAFGVSELLNNGRRNQKKVALLRKDLSKGVREILLVRQVVEKITVQSELFLWHRLPRR